MTGLLTKPPAGGFGALPGRQALRGYTDPNIDPKYAPARGAIAALYDARLRASQGKPLRGVGGPEATERTLRAYEGAGPSKREANGETVGETSSASLGGGGAAVGGAMSAAEAERKRAKKKSTTILGS